jgi:hypothetical protein
MVPGEELNGDSHLFSLNIPADRFIGSASGPYGPLIDIENAHNAGLYVGLAHPFQSDSQLQLAMNSSYNVDMVDDIYGDREGKFVTHTDVWDHYLNEGIFAMATAMPNVHNRAGIIRMNTDVYAIHVFSDSSDPAEIYENMVLGRSFIETVATTGGSSSNRTMNLYFSAQDDQVPMGRYPVIVDSDTDTANLHVIVTDIPAASSSSTTTTTTTLFSSLNLVIKRNGDAIGDPIPIPIEGGTLEFDRTFEFPLLDDDPITYFRYEIQDSSTGNVLAFSQPLIFIKAPPVFSDFWAALVPKSAALDMPADLISFDDDEDVLTLQVQARLPQGVGQQAVVKIFIPPEMFDDDDDDDLTINADSPEWDSNFDPSTRILTVNAVITSLDPITITVQEDGDEEEEDQADQEDQGSDDNNNDDDVDDETITTADDDNDNDTDGDDDTTNNTADDGDDDLETSIDDFIDDLMADLGDPDNGDDDDDDDDDRRGQGN